MVSVKGKRVAGKIFRNFFPIFPNVVEVETGFFFLTLIGLSIFFKKLCIDWTVWRQQNSMWYSAFSADKKVGGCILLQNRVSDNFQILKEAMIIIFAHCFSKKKLMLSFFRVFLIISWCKKSKKVSLAASVFTSFHIALKELLDSLIEKCQKLCWNKVDSMRVRFLLQKMKKKLQDSESIPK